MHMYSVFYYILKIFLVGDRNTVYNVWSVCVVCPTWLALMMAVKRYDGPRAQEKISN